MNTSETPNQATVMPSGYREGDLPGVGPHGAEEAEAHRPEPGSGAQQDARQGGARAFPESDDSDYLDRG